MRKWIKWSLGSLIALVLCGVIIIGWFYVNWFLPSRRYFRLHHAIYVNTSNDRLQLLAMQVVRLVGLSDLSACSRVQGNIPAEFKDLDPTWIDLNRDRVMVELHGGFDHFGFIIQRDEGDSNLWAIIRYDESGETQVGMYRHNGDSSNDPKPNTTPSIGPADGSHRQ